MPIPTRRIGVVSIVALSLLAAGGALAQSVDKSGKEMSQKGGHADKAKSWRAGHFIRIFDTDGNGSVSLAEIGAEQKRLIAATDVDGDGALSVDEFRRRGRLIRSIGATSLFDMLDTDGDQKVTAAEMAAPSARWFKRYDANADGGIVAEELPRRNKRGGWRHGKKSK